MKKAMMTRVQSEMMIESHSELLSTIHTDELSESETLQESMKQKINFGEDARGTAKISKPDSFSESNLARKDLLLEGPSYGRCI